MIYLGIDPGLNGALVALDPSSTVSLVTIVDTPTLTVVGKTGKRREYDTHAMAKALREFDDAAEPNEIFALAELVHAMPGQGVRSMFTMGRGVGVWEGLLCGIGIPFAFVTPQRWKKALMDGMGKDKDAARLTAMRLFPSIAGSFARKKDDGRAEAMLIAEYARRTRA